jgi:catechol 2,3-dioxygenase-like lactoylglutathione lyase family enzyme
MADHPRIEQTVTFIYTKDLDGTCRFYAETLGLRMVLDQGPCRIFRTGPSGFLGICSRPNRHVEPKGVVLTMVTPEVDAWYERLKSAGATLDGPPERSEEFNVYCFFARDPNGYMIEFQTFLSPDWPRP